MVGGGDALVVPKSLAAGGGMAAGGGVEGAEGPYNEGMASVEGVSMPFNSTPDAIVAWAAKIMGNTKAFLQRTLASGSYSQANFQTFMNTTTTTDFLDFIYEVWYVQQVFV